MSKVTINLESITCRKTQEVGEDEVYIKYSTDGGHPTRFPAKGTHSMDDGEIWIINLPISYAENCVIQLFDNDTAGSDFLGSQTYYVPDASQQEEKPIDGGNDDDYLYFIKTGPNQ